MTPVKFSIITVCFNAGKTIERTILSVRAQTYPHVEHIIVDGASTDGTMSIVRKYADRIGPMVSEKDKGIYDAMNKGIRMATGDVLYFLNADDQFFNDNVLEEVAQAYAEDASREVVYGEVALIDVPAEFKRYIKQGEEIKTRRDILLRYVCHQAFFARKSVFDRIGLYDTQYRYAADYAWIVSAFKRNQKGFYYIRKNIANYYFKGSSYQQNQECNTEKKWIKRKLLFPQTSWHFVRYVCIRTWKKKLLNEA